MQKDIQLSFTDRVITPWGGGPDVKENGFSECASRNRIIGSRVQSWVCAGPVDRAVSDQRMVRSKSL